MGLFKNCLIHIGYLLVCNLHSNGSFYFVSHIFMLHNRSTDFNLYRILDAEGPLHSDFNAL